MYKYFTCTIYIIAFIYILTYKNLFISYYTININYLASAIPKNVVYYFFHVNHKDSDHAM